jgi:hypothetical protein
MKPKYRNNQKKCEKADINKKGFCNWNYWDENSGLCLCTNKKGFGFKVNLCCPYIFRD